MLQSSVDFFSILKPIATPLRFLAACSLLGFCGWTLLSAIFDVVTRAKQMHQVPCTKCRFFTRDYRLKCTVQPHIANTEQAVDCPDYQQKH